MESQSKEDEEVEALVVPTIPNNSQLFLSPPQTYLRVKDNFILSVPNDEPDYRKSFVQLETLYDDENNDDRLVWRIRKGWDLGTSIVCMFLFLLLLSVNIPDSEIRGYVLSFGFVFLVLLCSDWIHYGCDQEIRAERNDDTVVTLTIRYQPEWLWKWFGCCLFRDQSIEIHMIANNTIDSSNNNASTSTTTTHCIFVKEYLQNQKAAIFYVKDTVFRVVALDMVRGTEFVILDGMKRPQEAFYIQQKLRSFVLDDEPQQRNHTALSSSATKVEPQRNHTTLSNSGSSATTNMEGTTEPIIPQSIPSTSVPQPTKQDEDEDAMLDSVIVTNMEMLQQPQQRRRRRRDYIVVETFVFPKEI